MMANKMTTRQPIAGAKATLPRKRYRLLFELESGCAFGGEYECEAFNPQDAMKVLEQQVPGAGVHVKSIRVLH